MDTLAAYGSDSDEDDSSRHKEQSGAPDRTDDTVLVHDAEDTSQKDSVSLALLPPPPLASSAGRQQSMMDAPKDYLTVKQREWVDAIFATNSATGTSGVAAARMPHRLAQIMSQQQQRQQQQDGVSSGWAVDHLKKQHEFYNPHLFAMVVEEYGLVDNVDGTVDGNQRIWDTRYNEGEHEVLGTARRTSM